MPLEQLDPVPYRPGGGDLLHFHDESLAIAKPVVAFRVQLVGLESLEPKGYAKRVPRRLCCCADGEPAVLRAHGLIRRAALVSRSETAGNLSVREEPARLPYRKRHGGLEQAHVDQLALARPFSSRQGSDRGQRAIESAREIADRDAHLD